ncbi:MAG: serine hydrolase domain-containing protein [Pseudomonadota bacterium]
MQVKKLLWIAGLCGSLAACGGDTPSPQVATDTLSMKVERFRAASGVPGLAVIVIEDDKVDVATSGVQRVGAPGVIGRDDQFQMGSLTKAVTASLLARLVEQNKLRWDATLAELFPAWREHMRPEYRGVTVTQLLRHRSGLPRDFSNADFAELQPLLTGDPLKDRAAAGLLFLQRPSQSTPGTITSYSNIGYLIAGLIAESIGNAPYEQLMAQQVLQPLQMKGRFGMPEDAGGQTPVGHIRAAQGWQVARYSPDMDDETQFHLWLFAVDAAGGLAVSAPDYSRFLLEQLHGLQGRSTYLKQENFQLMHTPVDGYAFGWGVLDVPQVGPVSFHSGTVGTYYATNRLIPGKNRAVAVMCNCKSDDSDRQIEDFANTLAGGEPQGK